MQRMHAGDVGGRGRRGCSDAGMQGCRDAGMQGMLLMQDAGHAEDACGDVGDADDAECRGCM